MKYAPVIFFISAFIFGTIFNILSANPGKWTITCSILLTTAFVIQYYVRRRHGEIFGSTDRNIYKIIFLYLKDSNYSENERKAILHQIFRSYSSVKIEKLFSKYVEVNLNLNTISEELKNASNEAKMFVLYSLLNIFSKDNILTKNEEDFLELVRKGIRIHPVTLQSIKNTFIKQGLKEERKIEEEAQRRKTSRSFSKVFFPFQAYNILGVSPNINKAQLKKIYRKLAMKHHPDKFHGQSKEIIQQAEDKFQEIKEAYEILLKYKQFS